MLAWFALGTLCTAVECNPGADLALLRAQLAAIIQKQDMIARGLYSWRAEYCPGYGPQYDQGRTEPAIREMPLIVMEKGKTVRVRHTIHWRQYAEDTLKITFVSSAAELVAPKELILTFEKHALEFEYAIRGTAEGDYTLILTPAVGQEVKVSVSVR